MTACGGAGGQFPSDQTSIGAEIRIPIPPVIESFTAEPATIEEGSQAVLSWVVSDPDATLSIVPSFPDVTGDELSVSPVVTTRYRLTATNAHGIDFASVTVSVVPPGSESPGEPESPGGQVADGEGTAWVNATTNLEGLSSECGNLSHVAADPSSDMVIAGVALQGLWALQGETDSWAQLGQGLGSEVVANRATSILWDPDNPATFWESGIHGAAGGYKTLDSGLTFRRFDGVSDVSAGMGDSDLISVDFSDPARLTMLSGGHEVGVVHRSTDGGQTWSDASAGLPDGVGYASSPLAIDSTTHLLGTWTGDESGIYRTTDGGLTWTRVSSVGVVGRPLVAPAEGAIYLVVGTESGDGEVHRRRPELDRACLRAERTRLVDGSPVAGRPDCHRWRWLAHRVVGPGNELAAARFGLAL